MYIAWQTMIKKLIINADDFGLHTSINKAVEITHQKGILTSSSLVVNGEAAEEAFQIARRNPNLGVGIHLTLNGEKPTAPLHQISSLLDHQGKLFENHMQFCWHVLRRKISLNHVRIELETQIQTFLHAGLIPTHVDGHRHIHLFLPIFNIIKELMIKYKISKIRFLRIPSLDTRKTSLIKLISLGILQFPKLTKPCFKSPDYFVGFFRSGSMSLDYLFHIIPQLKKGVSEINFHPATDRKEMELKYGFWKKAHRWEGQWEQEFTILLNPSLKNFIEQQKIHLVSYKDL